MSLPSAVWASRTGSASGLVGIPRRRSGGFGSRPTEGMATPVTTWVRCTAAGRVSAGRITRPRFGGSGPAFREAGRFASPIPDPDELAIRLSERLGEMGVGYAVSRLAAARFIEPYAPARAVDIYVDREPSELEVALELFQVDRGESVRLAKPSEPGVLQFTEERDGVTVVNPVQLFVDLINGRGREGDVAERLLENQLRGTWSVEEGS